MTTCKGYCHGCFAKSVDEEIYVLMQDLQDDMDSRDMQDVLQRYCYELFLKLVDRQYKNKTC